MEREHERVHDRERGHDRDPRAYWDDPLSKLLLDLVSLERTDKRGLGKNAWDKIHTRFNERTGRQYTLQQLKTKLTSLKKEHSIFKEDLTRTGLGRDPNGGVTAPSCYWQNLDVSHFTLPLSVTFHAKLLWHVA